LATPQRAYCRARPWRTLRKRPRAGRPRRPSGGGGRTITAGAAPGNVIARHRPDTGRTLAEPCRPLPGCIRRPKCAGRTLAAALPALPAEPTGPRASRRQRRCPPMADCLPAMAGRWAPIADSDRRRPADRRHCRQRPGLCRHWASFGRTLFARRRRREHFPAQRQPARGRKCDQIRNPVHDPIQLERIMG